jgi:hypothetical protein
MLAVLDPEGKNLWSTLLISVVLAKSLEHDVSSFVTHRFL